MSTFVDNLFYFILMGITLVFASQNENKIKEIQALLPNHIQIKSLAEINCFTDIPETGTTLEENAKIKADFVTQNYKLDCFADDSGLEVDYLNGAPGVYSARYAGEQKNSQDNIDLLLKNLENVTIRNACFKTVITLNHLEKQYFFTGIVNGKITLERKGSQGFGYDPIFIPEGYTKTFAEMTLEEKGKISHRALAIKQLVDFLVKI